MVPLYRSSGCARVVRRGGRVSALEALSPRDARRGRPSLLTPRLQAAIVASVKAGAFYGHAAEAAGISRNTFFEWMARGEGRDGRPSTPEFADFANEVSRARAQARVAAETRVYEENPLAWLRMGPGRDRGPDEPGWTDRASAPPPSSKQAQEQLIIRYVNDWREEPTIDATSDTTLKEPT